MINDYRVLKVAEQYTEELKMQDQKSEARLATLTHKVASSAPPGSIKLYDPSIDPVAMTTLSPPAVSPARSMRLHSGNPDE